MTLDLYLTIALMVWVVCTFSTFSPAYKQSTAAKFIGGFIVGITWPFLLFQAALRGVK